MKVLLIGHSIIDHIDLLGKNVLRPGGILYSVLGFLSQMKETDEIFLLTSWNEKSFYLFEKIYSQTNLKLSNKVDEMAEVFLKISSADEREETYKKLSGNLSTEKIKDWNFFDGILINMITGFDITLEQLQMIRKNFSGPIYFDVHTLSRGVNENMNRNFRQIPNAKDWMQNIDILQCNMSELKTICKYEREDKFSEEILNSGPKNLIVTKGNLGAKMFYFSKGKLLNYEVEGKKIISRNKIGCGDIFGAVFFYTYISTNDICISLIKANEAGAAAASIYDLANYSELIIND